MTITVAPPRLHEGARVRIWGRVYIVGRFTATGRKFAAADDGSEITLSFGRQNELVRSFQLIADAHYQVLTPAVLANLKRDMGGFSPAQREIATARHSYAEAISKLPVSWRDKSLRVDEVIEQVSGTAPGNLIKTPSFRQARTWYLRWALSGFDVRALVPNTAARGYRGPRYEPWVYEEINLAIDEVYATKQKGSIRQTLIRARQLIRVRSSEEGRVLPGLSKDAIGRKVVENVLADRGQWEILSKREDRREAERLMRLKGAGPSGEYPLGEVETDHTLLDIMVIRQGVVLGRPWLTLLIDRYSRMIIGFCISFSPPSWVSVMEALRQAVLPKEEELSRWAAYRGVPFVFDWPCFGAPDYLYVDRGSEFLSASLAATEACLNMKVRHLPKASGDKKGKVESNYHRIAKELIHRLNGTTSSNPQKRGRYNPAKEAIFTLDDLQYMVIRWVVDGHNRSPHPGTGEIPAERWRRGMEEVGEKPAPPKGIIAPLVGKVISRKLRDDGVRYKKLRWNSNQFRALRNEIGLSCDVLVRIDPLDLRLAYVLHPDTHEWIEGELRAETEIERMTLRQYEHVRKSIEDSAIVDEDYELLLARGAQEIWDFVNDVRVRKGIVPKPVAAFVTQRSRAIEHIHRERYDPEASTAPIASHNLDAPVTSPPPDPYGPYRDSVLRGTNPYPTKDLEDRYPGEWRPTATAQPAAAADPAPSTPTAAGARPLRYAGRRRVRPNEGANHGE